MVLVQVNMTNAPLAAAEAELRAWADFVRQERPAAVMAPTALCYHHSELLGNGVPVDAVVTAVPGADTDRVTYSETLGEFTFCLNPNSYFQVPPRSPPVPSVCRPPGCSYKDPQRIFATKCARARSCA